VFPIKECGISNNSYLAFEKEEIWANHKSLIFINEYFDTKKRHKNQYRDMCAHLLV
jgi:hypothetical protein